LAEKGMEQLEYDKTGVVEALRSIAERRGVKAVKERSYTGVSGLKHLFDFTLVRGGDDVKVDVAYSRGVVDEKGVIAGYAKLIDTGAQGYVLVAWPRLSGEAKTLAAHYKMKVIEASTFEELERAFSTLLDGLKG